MTTDVIPHIYHLKGGEQEAVERNNPILDRREPAVIYCDDGTTKLKIGDGVTPLNDLPYVGGNTIQPPESQGGKSAYEIAVEQGFEGSEAEWLESLNGDPGIKIVNSVEKITDAGVYMWDQGLYDVRMRPWSTDMHTLFRSKLDLKSGIPTDGLTTQGASVEYQGFPGYPLLQYRNHRGDSTGVTYLFLHPEGHSFRVFTSDTGECLPCFEEDIFFEAAYITPSWKSDFYEGLGISVNHNWSLIEKFFEEIVVTKLNKSAYDIAVENGYAYDYETEEDWLARLQGKDGISVAKTEINNNGELVITLSNNTVCNLGVVVGAKGGKGDKGEPGESAHAILREVDSTQEITEAGVYKIKNELYTASNDEWDRELHSVFMFKGSVEELQKIELTNRYIVLKNPNNVDNPQCEYWLEDAYPLLQYTCYSGDISGGGWLCLDKMTYNLVMYATDVHCASPIKLDYSGTFPISLQSGTLIDLSACCSTDMTLAGTGYDLCGNWARVKQYFVSKTLIIDSVSKASKELPEVTAADAGKILTVSENGEWELKSPISDNEAIEQINAILEEIVEGSK